jgi:MinD superfamily P-loop ATPase
MKISIASGKGGTGKTTLATNLASMISEKTEVVLIDLDVEEPNSGLFIRAEMLLEESKHKRVPAWIEEKCSLCGVCQNVCNFHAVIRMAEVIMVFPELCHGCYACSELCPEEALPMANKKMGVLKHFRNKNLHFVESRLDIGEEQAVPLIRQTVKYVDTHFTDDILKIADCPPGTSCPVIEATRDADYVILVTEPTPFGLHDLKIAVETLQYLKKDFGVVVNRSDIGNRDVFDFCHTEEIPVLASIPNDRRVAEMYSRGEMVYPGVTEFRAQLQKVEMHIHTINTRVPS